MYEILRPSSSNNNLWVSITDTLTKSIIILQIRSFAHYLKNTIQRYKVYIFSRDKVVGKSGYDSSQSWTIITEIWTIRPFICLLILDTHLHLVNNALCSLRWQRVRCVICLRCQRWERNCFHQTDESCPSNTAGIFYNSVDCTKYPNTNWLIIIP